MNSEQQFDYKFKDLFMNHLFPGEFIEGEGSYPVPDLISNDSKILIEFGTLNTKEGSISYSKDNSVSKAISILKRINELFNQYPQALEIWWIPYPANHKQSNGIFTFSIYTFKSFEIKNSKTSLLEISKIENDLDNKKRELQSLSSQVQQLRYLIKRNQEKLFNIDKEFNDLIN